MAVRLLVRLVVECDLDLNRTKWALQRLIELREGFPDGEGGAVESCPATAGLLARHQKAFSDAGLA